MEDIAILESLVRRTARRRRWIRGWNAAAIGALVGISAFLAVLILDKRTPIPVLWLKATGAAALLATAGGFLVGFLRRIDLPWTARWLDTQAGLQDRISTALEVARNSGSPTSREWRALVVADAVRAAGRVDPRALLPLALPRSAGIASILALLALGLRWVPEHRTVEFRQQENTAAVLRDVGTNLATLARRSLQERPAPAEPIRREIQSVAELGERLQGARLSQNDALAELARAAEPLQKRADELARDPALRRMERAARSRSDSVPSSPAALQKRMQERAESMGAKAAETPEAVDRLRQDLRKLQEQARAMASSANPGADGSASKVGEATADLARRADELGLSLPDLNEAIASLQGAQVERFLKNLEQAGTSLEATAARASQLAQMRQPSERLGKDLAEQLQNGQTELALDSLKRLMKALGTRGEDPQTQGRGTEELERSLKPAGEYGKVADHLKDALKKSRNGDAQGTRSALEEARRELQGLLDEQADAQQLMAALDSLKSAQAAVGNGAAWAKNPAGGSGAGAGKKGGGPGARGGKGVGTWSDNNAWAFPESIEESWDNSGVSRPDLAARGTTERDTARPDSLVPTKVPGQFQPGGPMPSISLRGVSIKGSSSVTYAEAVTAAQAEARSALSEDQVPKVYRGTVRDYFDDLRK